MKIRHWVGAVAAGLALTASAAGVAHAANPHYTGNGYPKASVNTSTGALQVSFKAAGYGRGENVDYELSHQGYVLTLGCLNKGGNEPSGLRTYTDGPDATTGTVTASRTGQITATVSLTPEAASDFRCPSRNMSVVVVSATYYDVMFELDPLDPVYWATVSYTR
jgi:hypothetical protein